MQFLSLLFAPVNASAADGIVSLRIEPTKKISDLNRVRMGPFYPLDGLTPDHIILRARAESVEVAIESLMAKGYDRAQIVPLSSVFDIVTHVGRSEIFEPEDNNPFVDPYRIDYSKGGEVHLLILGKKGHELEFGKIELIIENNSEQIAKVQLETTEKFNLSELFRYSAENGTQLADPTQMAPELGAKIIDLDKQIKDYISKKNIKLKDFLSEIPELRVQFQNTQTGVDQSFTLHRGGRAVIEAVHPSIFQQLASSKYRSAKEIWKKNRNRALDCRSLFD